MENQTIQNEDYEEIDLRQVVEVLLKRKKIVILFTVIAAFAALLISLTLPKIYKTSSVLEVGTISKDGNNLQLIEEARRIDGNNLQLIEEARQIVGKINSDVYGPAIRQKLGIDQNHYPAVTAVNPADTNTIILSVQNSDPEIAKKILDEISNQIILEHQKVFDAAKKTIESNIAIENSNIDRLSKKIESLNAEIATYQKQIDFLKNNGSFDIGTQFMILNLTEQLQKDRQDIENLNLTINDSSRRISSLQNILAMIKPTSVIKPPIVSENPVSPKITLNVAISAILGLFAGVVAAFGIEWWKRGKQEK